jgi:hypothetical protein
MRFASFRVGRASIRNGCLVLAAAAAAANLFYACTSEKKTPEAVGYVSQAATQWTFGPVNRAVFMSLYDTEHHIPNSAYTYTYFFRTRTAGHVHWYPIGPDNPQPCSGSYCWLHNDKHGAMEDETWQVNVYVPAGTGNQCVNAYPDVSGQMSANQQVWQGAGNHGHNLESSGQYCALMPTSTPSWPVVAKYCSVGANHSFAVFHGSTTTSIAGIGVAFGYAAKHDTSNITVVPSIGFNSNGLTGNISFNMTSTSANWAAGTSMECDYQVQYVQQSQTLNLQEECWKINDTLTSGETPTISIQDNRALSGGPAMTIATAPGTASWVTIASYPCPPADAGTDAGDSGTDATPEAGSGNCNQNSSTSCQGKNVGDACQQYPSYGNGSCMRYYGDDPQSCFCGPPADAGTGGGDSGTACVPTTCFDMYPVCGIIPDGCGGTLDCGPCSDACVPTTCDAEGVTCGTIPDLCGNTLDCGPCDDGGSSSSSSGGSSGSSSGGGVDAGDVDAQAPDATLDAN